jgi:hypothetical protein
MPSLEGKTPGGGRNPVYLVGNPEVFSGFALPPESSQESKYSCATFTSSSRGACRRLLLAHGWPVRRGTATSRLSAKIAMFIILVIIQIEPATLCKVNAAPATQLCYVVHQVLRLPRAVQSQTFHWFHVHVVQGGRERLGHLASPK